jgi:hypothetical protein
MNGTIQKHRFVNGSGGQIPPAFQRGDHRDVDQAVGELQEWCREVGELGCPKINELGTRLRSLQDIAKRHFAEEEEGGYMADVLERDPGRAHEVSALLAQHPQFVRRFETLIDGLCAVEPCFDRWTTAVREVRHLLSDLKVHEHSEIRLMQTVLGTDVGAGD